MTNWFDELYPVRTKPMSSWPDDGARDDEGDDGDAPSPAEVPWQPQDAPSQAMALAIA